MDWLPRRGPIVRYSRVVRDSGVIILVLSIAQKNNRRSALDDDIDVVPLILFDWTHWTNNTMSKRERERERERGERRRGEEESWQFHLQNLPSQLRLSIREYRPQRVSPISMAT